MYFSFSCGLKSKFLLAIFSIILFITLFIGFAQAYFLKVKERLGGTELYQAFLHTMNEFGRSILEVRDLYYKVTALLSQHPDLSEEFLAFLLPEQAMQCGKLMEYLMITMMKDFFRRLEVSISRDIEM